MSSAGESGNSVTHPYPKLIDPRRWCRRCGDHVATEWGIAEICPCCIDEFKRNPEAKRAFDQLESD